MQGMPTTQQRKRPQPLEVRVAMAILASEGKLGTEIARQFNVHPSTVSRVIKEAVAERWLDQTPSFDGSKFDQALLKQAQKLAQQPPELQDRIAALAAKGDLPHKATVRLLRLAEDGRAVTSIDEFFRSAGRSAAPHVLELLRGAATCGLTWGHTVGAVVAGIESLDGRRRDGAGALQVLPLCGEPLLEDSLSMYSSSSLAERLSAAVNGSAADTLPLTMLPAFVPGQFTRAEVEAVWKMISLIDAYGKIFGGREVRLALRDGRPGKYRHKAMALDMILTGISAVGQPLGDNRGPLFDSGKLSENAFREMVLGDIGGVLIERAGLRPDQRAALDDLATRWTGISSVEMHGCAKRAAAKGGPPGVVVVAMGRNKSETLVEALRRGLVNHLLIDWDLEREILSRLQ